MKPNTASLIAPRMLTALLILLAHAGGTRSALAQAQSSGAETYRNPVLWQDLADLDVIRVGDAYYYSASNMHYSPGAPILRSYDLVNWEYVGHSIPVLDFSPAYNLDGGRAYVKGSWASFLGYRKSNKTFYWGGCIEFKKTYLYTAPAAEGPWQKKAVLDHCYYDAGLLIDDDDTMYVAYGNKTLHVAQLSPDGTKEIQSKVVFETPPEIGVLEGSRFYKVNGTYYIFTTRPANAEYVLKSTHGPFGPYEIKLLLKDTKIDIPGAGVPHQGGIVQTQAGKWYYMAFIDAFPGGRVPVLAPLAWGDDGWPSVQLTKNTWSLFYPKPDVPKVQHPTKPMSGTDTFDTPMLDAQWEWNHNPDNARWSTGSGLTLHTATVTDDLYAARNTLTHRITGPASTATIVMDVSGMKDGDYAGLAMFRDSSAWIGVTRQDGQYKVVMRSDITMDQHWNTLSKGTDVASAPLAKTRIWLRVTADIRPGPGRLAKFAYSTDGSNFTPLGEPFVLNDRWQFFMGYRFGIFNYGSKMLGGLVRVKSFVMTSADRCDRQAPKVLCNDEGSHKANSDERKIEQGPGAEA